MIFYFQCCYHHLNTISNPIFCVHLSALRVDLSSKAIKKILQLLFTMLHCFHLALHCLRKFLQQKLLHTLKLLHLLLQGDLLLHHLKHERMSHRVDTLISAPANKLHSCPWSSKLNLSSTSGILVLTYVPAFLKVLLVEVLVGVCQGIGLEGVTDEVTGLLCTVIVLNVIIDDLTFCEIKGRKSGT